MAKGDVITEVYKVENGKRIRTGTAAYNEEKGTVRDVWKKGTTVQSTLKIGKARENNPRNNPTLKARQGIENAARRRAQRT